MSRTVLPSSEATKPNSGSQVPRWRANQSASARPGTATIGSIPRRLTVVQNATLDVVAVSRKAAARDCHDVERRVLDNGEPPGNAADRGCSGSGARALVGAPARHLAAAVWFRCLAAG